MSHGRALVDPRFGARHAMLDPEWLRTSCFSTRCTLVRSARALLVLLRRLCSRNPCALVITSCVLIVSGIILGSFGGPSGWHAIENQMKSYWSPTGITIEYYWGAMRNPWGSRCNPFGVPSGHHIGVRLGHFGILDRTASYSHPTGLSRELPGFPVFQRLPEALHPLRPLELSLRAW